MYVYEPLGLDIQRAVQLQERAKESDKKRAARRAKGSGKVGDRRRRLREGRDPARRRERSRLAREKLPAKTVPGTTATQPKPAPPPPSNGGGEPPNGGSAPSSGGGGAPPPASKPGGVYEGAGPLPETSPLPGVNLPGPQAPKPKKGVPWVPIGIAAGGALVLYLVLKKG